MKYEIPLLDRSTRFLLWQVNICDVLAQMDLDDALLGFDIVDKRGETTLRIVKPYLRFTFIYRIKFCKTFERRRLSKHYGWSWKSYA